MKATNLIKTATMLLLVAMAVGCSADENISDFHVNEIWTQEKDLKGNDGDGNFRLEVAKYSNGDFLVGGEWNYGWLSRIDQTGKVIWEKNITEDIRTFSVLPNDKMVLGAFKRVKHGLIDIDPGSDFYLVKIDKDGNVVDEYTVGTIAHELVNKVFYLGDDDFLILGSKDARHDIDNVVFKWNLKTGKTSDNLLVGKNQANAYLLGTDDLIVINSQKTPDTMSYEEDLYCKFYKYTIDVKSLSIKTSDNFRNVKINKPTDNCYSHLDIDIDPVNKQGFISTDIFKPDDHSFLQIRPFNSGILDQKYTLSETAAASKNQWVEGALDDMVKGKRQYQFSDAAYVNNSIVVAVTQKNTIVFYRLIGTEKFEYLGFYDVPYDFKWFRDLQLINDNNILYGFYSGSLLNSGKTVASILKINLGGK